MQGMEELSRSQEKVYSSKQKLPIEMQLLLPQEQNCASSFGFKQKYLEVYSVFQSSFAYAPHKIHTADFPDGVYATSSLAGIFQEILVW